MTFFLSYSSRNILISSRISKRQLFKGSASIKERFREMVQLKEMKFTKAEGSGGEFRRVLQPGGEKYRSHGIMFCRGSENARKVLCSGKQEVLKQRVV